MYRSQYEAYPFLPDAPEDLRCDFELATDRIASQFGLLRAMTDDEALREELLKVCGLVYHLNPTLRTRWTVTDDELAWLKERLHARAAEAGQASDPFVLPQGSLRASTAHLIRVDAKSLVRLMYRHIHQGHAVDPRAVDFANLLSGYAFQLARAFNLRDGVPEVPFHSRNYGAMASKGSG